MAEPQRIVIIGAGLAGATAAATLRERGFGGEVLVLGAEQHRPYELPPLSKRVLLGEGDDPDWVHDENFYVANDIDLRRGVEATRVELGSRTVSDSHGGEHEYDQLLFATGSEPRKLPVEGADLPGIHTLRSIDDALELRASIEQARHVVIVGAGWIGCEVAAAARSIGADVTVVDPLPLPMNRVLGDEVAQVFADLHTDHGVQWQLGVGVAEFHGVDAVEGVVLSNGKRIDGDVVLMAVGAAPRSALAKAAGVQLSDDGAITVDAGLRSTTPDVFAVGDVAAQFHPRYGTRIRVEHWANAKNQGAHVAGSMLGESVPYVRSPFFFTDQYDLGCEYRGFADPDADELVVRGELASREFTAFWLRAGAVRAAMNVNVWDDGDALKALVDGQVKVDADALRTADLASLVPG